MTGRGEWTCEYRVRPLSPDEQGDACRRTGRFDAWVLERRYQCTDPGCDHHDPWWRPWDTGSDERAAAFSCRGDTQYQEARSLHPLHEAMRALVAEGREREARIQALLEETHYRASVHGALPEWREVDVDADERARSDGAYEEALKRARLYSRAMRDEAPPERVEAIRAEVQADHERRVAERRARHEAALAELARLRRIAREEARRLAK